MQLKKYANEINKKIQKGEITTKKELDKCKLVLGEKFHLSAIPTNPNILAKIPNPSQKTKNLLSIKPLRTLSGVAPVAIMTKPINCPHGTCIYCPGGPNSYFGDVPQSYTGNEPATMRAINNQYNSYLQTMNRISQYYSTAHYPQKLELIIMGGTFPSFEKNYQEEFISGAFGAANDFSEMFFQNSEFTQKKFNTFFKDAREIGNKNKEKFLDRKKNSAKEEHKRNETSNVRIVTLCIETKPDWCKEKHINNMLKLGTTRVELGVQSIYNEVLKYTNRGHTVEDSKEATQLLKDSALKVTYHLMPGQPKSTTEMDKKMFKEIFSNPDYRPDGLKIYPCMVMPGTALEQLYKKGKFSPLTTEEAAELIAEANSCMPAYTRIHRVQRDIPTKLSLGGVDKNNLRQIVEQKMKEKKIDAREIRARESGINLREKTIDYGAIKILKEEYEASKGKEIFISAEDKTNNLLLGFCRLRNPHKPFREEFSENTACIRELHVFGTSLLLGEKRGESSQHKGIGTKLMKEAEQTAVEKFGSEKMLVISGIGAREYYKKKHGYKRDGIYMGKKLK